MHGLPKAYSGVDAAIGASVRVTITGASGGTWLVMCADSKWLLCEAELREYDAQLIIDEIDAWKLFTKSIPREDVESKVVVEGDTQLGLKALDTVSIIA